MSLVGSRKTISPSGLRCRRRRKAMLEVRERSPSKRDSYYFGKLAQALRFEGRGVEERGVRRTPPTRLYRGATWPAICMAKVDRTRRMLHYIENLTPYRLNSRTSCPLLLRCRLLKGKAFTVAKRETASQDTFCSCSEYAGKREFPADATYQATNGAATYFITILPTLL